MQRRHIGVGELLGIGQLFLAVVDHQHANGQAQQQQGRVCQGPIGQEVGRSQPAQRSRQIFRAPQPEAGGGSTNQRAMQAARKPANSSSNREVDMDGELATGVCETSLPIRVKKREALSESLPALSCP
jgi:hypothetical protein